MPATPQALLTAHSFLGLGVETTRNTPVVPAYYVPVEPPQWVPAVTWIEDKGLRGSPSDVYSNQAGVRHDEYDAKGNVFADTIPVLLRNILGSTDTVTAAPTSTTLSALAAAGATTVSTVASIPVGSAITIGSGVTAETHITSAVSGAGPFTVTLKTALVNGQASGAAVTGQTAHKIGQLYSVATGSQPPSVTLVDFTAGEAGTTTARQMAGSMLSDLSLMFASTAPTTYTAKWFGLAATTVAAPTQSYSGEILIPSWSCAVYLAGLQSFVVLDGQIDIKRSTAPIHTLGQQSPYQIWDSALNVAGKLTFVLQQGDTTITNAAVRNAQTLALAFNDPFSNHLVQLQMSQIQLKEPKINRGKSYLEVETMFSAEANTTDAVGGGYSPILSYIGNAVTAAY